MHQERKNDTLSRDCTTKMPLPELNISPIGKSITLPQRNVWVTEERLNKSMSLKPVLVVVIRHYDQ